MFDIATFLGQYQKYPCLWDKSYPTYKNRQIRDQAEKALAINFNFQDVKSLRSKIRAIRGTFNTELRKIKNSKLSGVKDVYKPKLVWFNDAYAFLSKNNNTESRTEANLILNCTDYEQCSDQSEHQEIEEITTCSNYIASVPTSTQNRKRSQNDQEINNIQRQSEERATVSSGIPSASKKTVPYQKRSRQQCQNDILLQEAINALKDVEQNAMTSEFTVFGRQVGIQLNKLSLPTALKIQQKIQNILTEARLEELDTTSFSPAGMSTPLSLSKLTPISIISPDLSSSDNSVLSPEAEHYDGNITTEVKSEQKEERQGTNLFSFHQCCLHTDVKEF